MDHSRPSDSISDFFQQDHREIDPLLFGLDFRDPLKTLPRFEDFDRRLERHIRWEEELLFPAAGAANRALEQGPLIVMREDHVRIRAAKADALAALRRGDGTGAKTHSDRMVAILCGHNLKEERILYPACDQLLSSRERQVILEEVRSSKSG